MCIAFRDVCKKSQWDTNQRCQSLEWRGFLCLIEIEIQRSEEVARCWFCAAVTCDVGTAIALPILRQAPEEKQTHLRKRKKRELPSWLSVLSTGHCLFEDAGWIHGLDQWVKDLVLL